MGDAETIEDGRSGAHRPPLRKDAQRNIQKLLKAAFGAFQQNGLGVALEDIAQQAGVSTGTLYNRFGNREALIDAVLPDLAEPGFAEITRQLESTAGAWARFERFIMLMHELQSQDPVLNDIVSRRFPASNQLQGACERTAAIGRQLMEEAQQEGELRADFTAQDLYFLLWSNAVAIRALAEAGSPHQRNWLRFMLDGLRARPRPASPRHRTAR